MSVRWPDVDHPRTPSGWSWPPNLLVAQGPASWPRGRRPASEAEEILSEAVAWWDVERSGFRDGDRWLRNLGTGGGVLDLRLGSSLLANSNDPKWLGVDQTGYVYLPGVAGNYLSVPDEAALDVTGDIDIRAFISYDSGAAAYSALVNKQNSSARGYILSFGSTTGTLYAVFGSAATSLVDVQSSAHGVPANTPYWFRVTRVAATGVVEFLKSPDGVTWTSISTHTLSAFSLHTNAIALSVGFDGGATYLAGRVYRAVVKDGIDGTTVLDIDCDTLTSGSATSFTASTGQTVTINRSTSGRKSVAMPSRAKGGRACMLLGTDDYLEVVDSQQHGLLNFRGADSLTALAVVRQWATSVSLGPYINKWTQTGGQDLGWALTTAASAPFSSRIGDGTVNSQQATVTGAYGTQQVGALRIDRRTGEATASANGTTGSALSMVRQGSLANTVNVMVGRRSYQATYQDFEFRAAAIWRRPLTSREITVLANSGIWGT